MPSPKKKTKYAHPERLCKIQQGTRKRSCPVSAQPENCVKPSVMDTEAGTSSDLTPVEQVGKSSETEMNINCLPVEVLIMIFLHLKHNDLGRIAQVNKKWQELTRSQVLWKKVDVRFQCKYKCQNKVAALLFEKLPTYVTHMKLDFQNKFGCIGDLKFDDFCMCLRAKCPLLKVLILRDTRFSISQQSVIDVCSQYLSNLEILSISYSDFTDYCIKGEYGGYSKIKVLDIFYSCGTIEANKLTFSKMSSLRKLSLHFTSVNDGWFKEDISFLHKLEILNLQQADIGSRTFQTLQNHALNLTELFLCGTNLKDSDFTFSSSVFPQLRIICLRRCREVSCEGIVSLIDSCRTLKEVYVDEQVAESYAQHPLVVVNKCKLLIVKTIDYCLHVINDYLYHK